MSLAGIWLVREWRHFVPSILAVAFSCLLLVVQAALVLGIFGSAAIYVEASDADIWVGQPNTQSVNFGQPIERDVENYVRMDPNVSHVEPYLWVDGNWRVAPGAGAAISVFVSGIEPYRDGMMFTQLLSLNSRQLLRDPGAVVVDRADLDQLGLSVGEAAWINGHPVHVVATVSGLRALGGVNVIASYATAQALRSDPNDQRPTYLVARLFQPSAAAATRDRLVPHASFGSFEVWTAAEFSRRSQHYWLLDTGAGVAVLFMAVIVLLVGAVVTGQALVSVVLRAQKEYAVLMALGVDRWALARVVIAQSAWIGCAGIVIGGVGSLLLLLAAHANDVPVAMVWYVGFICAAMVMALALISGAIAIRGVLRADPATLLR